MLYIVGLGLGGEHGITVRGLDAVRRCARIYMEARTALLTFGVDGDPSSRLTKLGRVTFSVSPLDDPILALLLSGARRRLSTAWSTRGPAKRRSSLVTTTPPLISRALQENLYGNAVTIAGREIVEGEGGDQILREATGADIAFLVVGHPFG